MSRVNAWQLHSRAGLLSATVLGCALALLWLGNQAKVQAPERLTLRTVHLAPPPPPPPPPPVQTPVTEAQLNVTLAGTGASLPQIQLSKPKVALAPPKMTALAAPEPDWRDMAVDWQAFSLAELDSLPSLTTPLQVRLPKSLSRRGVTEVLVKLDIVVDEKGQVTLVGVVENSYPELLPEIARMVRGSRFTPPRKGDESVRARFIWPVNIKG